MRVRESDNNFHTTLCLLSTGRQYKGTQVALQRYPVIERSISSGKITIIELFQQTSNSSLPHSTQTLEPKANTGNADSRRLRKLSQGSPNRAAEQLTNSSAMGFKSSLTLTTPKEGKRRKEG